MKETPEIRAKVFLIQHPDCRGVSIGECLTCGHLTTWSPDMEGHRKTRCLACREDGKDHFFRSFYQADSDNEFPKQNREEQDRA